MACLGVFPHLPAQKIKHFRQTLLKSPASSLILALLYKGTQGYKYFVDYKYCCGIFFSICHAHLKAHIPVHAIQMTTKLPQNNFW